MTYKLLTLNNPKILKGKDKTAKARSKK